MQDFFAGLASGIRFKRKPKPLVAEDQDAAASERKVEAPDFFKQSTVRGEHTVAKASSKNQESKKRKRSKQQQQQQQDDAEENEGEDAVEMKEDEVNAFRRRLQIHVKGGDVPNPCATFSAMNLHPALKPIILSNIEASEWKEPTAIQMQSIPALLEGRDVLAAAPTGSGKTAAFSIPLLSKLQAPSKDGIRALVLAPTRELAAQIQREMLRLCAGRKFRIALLKKASASTALAQQDKAALSGHDVLVATPLRLLTLIRESAIDLSKVQFIVLDEADKLFEMGRQGKELETTFLGQIDEILSACATGDHIQRALFSATIGPQIEELSLAFLRDPIRISIGVANAGATTIDQKLVFVGREDGKLLAMRQLVQAGLKPPVLIFLQSKDRAKELFRELVYDGINVEVIHAERTQEQRDNIIRRFRTGDIWVLICTDLMARGVDFKGVNMVINYDFPQSAVSYIHRIGRTGRAGRRGTAVTFFTEDDVPYLRSIANVMKLSGCEVPDWMLTIKPLSTKEKRRRANSAPKRRRISTVSKYDRKKGKKHRNQSGEHDGEQGGEEGAGGDEEA